MRLLKPLALPVAACFALGALYTAGAQQGPGSQPSETVAKPRKKPASGDEAAPPPSDEPKIPSRFPKGGKKELPEGTPTFRADVTTVSVDVAVLDNKGHFIP